jgi:hypothetical protein
VDSEHTPQPAAPPQGEREKERGFFRRAFGGGFCGCLGIIAALVVVLVVVGAIAAVLGAGEEDDADVVNTGVTPQSSPGENGGTDGPDVLNLAIGSTARVGDAEVTVHGARRSSGGEFLSPDAGNVWVIVDATVRNTGDDAYNISSLLQTALRDSTGVEHDITIGADTSGQLDGTIPPGDILRGETAFEVPLTATGLQFVFTQALGNQVARWNIP